MDNETKNTKKDKKPYIMIISPNCVDTYIMEYETIEELKEAVLDGDNCGNEYIIVKRLDIEIKGE